MSFHDLETWLIVTEVGDEHISLARKDIATSLSDVSIIFYVPFMRTFVHSLLSSVFRNKNF